MKIFKKIKNKKYPVISDIKCPKCNFEKNEGINKHWGFIQVKCKKCGESFQYSHIFEVVVPFGKHIYLSVMERRWYVA